MKLSFAAFACAMGIATAGPGKVRKLSPAVQVHNSVYAGKDFGLGCGRLGKKSVADNTEAALVYCFEVVNTGNTRLTNVVLTNPELNGFYDNSIHHLEPGQSKIVPFIYTLSGDLVNNVVVSATPVHPDGTPIDNLKVIQATDSSEVIDVIARNRKLVLSSNSGYASPVAGMNNCIQQQWEDAGQPDELICAARDQVSLRDVAAQEDATCVAGYTTKTLTIDASIIIAVSQLFDLGWYIDTALGGDAMTGSECIVNGLIEPNEYVIVNANNPTVPFGDVKWGTPTDNTDDITLTDAHLDDLFGAGAKIDPKAPNDRKKKRKKNRKQRRRQVQVIGGGDDNTFAGGDDNTFAGGDDNTFTGIDDYVGGMDNGDGDECGDIYIHGEDEAMIKIPIAVNVVLSCEDQNKDGDLDFPICFTWRDDGAAECTFDSNLPEDSTGGCFCTRYDVPNVQVVEIVQPPVNDTLC